MNRSFEHPPTPLRRRLLAATLAVAGLAGVATATTTAAAADAPHAGTRAEIPWRSVGPGWTLATWAKSQQARTTLYLVAPDGRRWSVARSLNPDVTPRLWSPDGRRAIVSGDHGVLEVDLHTGRSHVVHLSEDSYVLSYSRPRGRALLAEVDVPQGDHLVARLERFDEYGHHQQTYPAKVAGAGTLDTTGVVETADGAQLVVGADHGLVLLNNHGSVVRRLHAGTTRCSVASWWSRTSVLASCGGALRSVPLSGGQGRAVSAGPSKTNPFGYETAWNYSGGRLGLAINGCGPSTLVRFGPHGNGVRIAVPAPDGHRSTMCYVGHHGDTVDFLSRRPLGCESGTTALVGYHAVTHRSTALLGPGVNGGTVEGAVEYPTR